MRDETLVEWREWGEAAFAEARAQSKPLLLSLSASWCVACDEMDRGAYADPRLAGHLTERFVPVRIDVDRQPRVRERYNMGGFPSTVFCTPEGKLITGAGYLSPDGLRRAIDTVRKTWDEKGADAGRVPRALQNPEPPRGEVTAEIEAHFVEQSGAAFDDEFGGWGTDAKFPLPRTVEFAAKRDTERASRTLQAIQAHLYDTYAGGFYRYATNRNWAGNIHREKLTDENAALVRAFATGYLHTGDESYRDTARGTVEYLTTDLWTGEAFAGSQAGGDYYALGPAEREEAEPPVVDETVYADRNGLAADALFRFAGYTDDERSRAYASRAIEHVTDTLVDDGVVTHYDDPESESGLLLDGARVLLGLTAGVQATGERAYLDTAREIAADLRDRQADDGAFLDGPEAGVGLLDQPLRPLDANVELANALVDLAVLTGEDSYRELAGETLEAFAGAATRMGADVAGYGAACARHVYDPLVIETPVAGSDLHRAAWRVADHEKVIVPSERSDAVVVRGGERSTPAETPEELLERAAETPSESITDE
ncbi:thioredoxin domain-containing protein [Halobacteriales archaeon QH_7_65_31]|nr:MAG: thioredoxin domain-containing protein [Halobacteriales archaeon QH_7_65_31]